MVILMPCAAIILNRDIRLPGRCGQTVEKKNLSLASGSLSRPFSISKNCVKLFFSSETHSSDMVKPSGINAVCAPAIAALLPDSSSAAFPIPSAVDSVSFNAAKGVSRLKNAAH